MNINEAAIEILHAAELKPLMHGLCYALRQMGAPWAYHEVAFFMEDCFRLPNYGVWTDQRLNIVILLAITTPEDFI